jgi:hypothetical protein
LGCWITRSGPNDPSKIAPAPSGDGDNLAELERLAKLRDSGAFTDAELQQQKARILGS